VRKKLGKVSLFESGSPVAANETSGYPSPDKTIAADMAAGVHAGPTTPRSGGIVSFGSIITCAPVRAISQLHPLGTECGHRLYFSLFVFITSTATRNADSHSVTKLGGISELMDGERKPNVKFWTADVTSTIVPIISSKRKTRAVQWRCMSDSSLAIFFPWRFSLPKLRRRIHWCEENLNSQLADRSKAHCKKLRDAASDRTSEEGKRKKRQREWVHTKEEDW
jgi:hypothetical protein